MAYQTALTIGEVINDLHQKKYLLPAIQREFVWTTDQIETLFDSLMRDYPISSFLFWKVEKESVKEYEFYEFLRSYHERNSRHNPKANVTGEEDVTAVLDGQQRLTSLYIALKGDYAFKMPRKRWDNDRAYPKRKLYLNLLSPSTNDGLEYDFRFLTEKESQNNNENDFWFEVGEILNLKQQYEVNQYLIENGIFQLSDPNKASFANKSLFKLFDIIHEKGLISYFLEKSQELDKVLNIFIRINSGGTVLSYSDLLLSIATAQWEEKDAREEITKFVDEINNVGSGFNFNKDFVLKACLVMSDISEIAFKVDNFNKANMLKIEQGWEAISKAIRLSVELVSNFGYSRDTLTSNNAIIPIAYFILKKELEDSFLTSQHFNEDRKVIKKWLILSLMKRAFSGQPDSVLRPIRKILKENLGEGFALNKIIDQFKGTNKSLIFTEEDIDSLLSFKYGQSYTFSILSTLYPWIDYRNKFHLDHIFPKSLFTNTKLRRLGVSEDNLGAYKERVNLISNLQLLEATPNIEKSDRPFDVWLQETHTEEEIPLYLEKHYMAKDEPRDFLNFINFFDERESILKERLKELLNVKDQKENEDD